MTGPISSDGGPARPKRRRVTRSAEFDRVYRKGRSRANRFFVVYQFPREDSAENVDEGPRLGLSVGKRVGGAVQRARVKRVIRESFWGLSERLPAGSDYVVVARTPAGPLAEDEGLAGVDRELTELIAGLGKASGSGADERTSRGGGRG